MGVLFFEKSYMNMRFWLFLHYFSDYGGYFGTYLGFDYYIFYVKQIVNSLLESYKKLENSIQVAPLYQPNIGEVVEFIDKLRCLLFPGYFSEKHLKHENISYYIEELLKEAEHLLKKQLSCLLKKGEKKTAKEFLAKLSKIRASLATDVDAAFNGDPAAYTKEEIIVSYPGIYAISVYRLAHELSLLGVPALPRIMTEHAHSVTGIDIHPGAQIGDYFFIDHGTGIVIGETTVIGENVKIYQGVTLGALSTRGGQRLRGQKRHPTVEDNVTIYSGASIFGGDTVIGKNSVLGSNVFVTESVPADSKLSINDKPLKKQKSSQKY
jgi:serine O-acetyltransferase